MPTKQIIVCEGGGAAALARAAAERFAEIALPAADERGRCTVALAGGSTPRKLYETLAAEPWRGRIPWADVHLFFGDERHVPPDDEQSNYRMARESLIERVPQLPAENVRRVHAEDADAGRAALDYENDLRRFFGAPDGDGGEWPRFDLILLGLGPDGHTASLFPGTDALAERERWVVAPWVEKFSAHRITLTAPLINRARTVIFLVGGAEKAEIVRDILGGDGGAAAASYPAQLIAPIDGELLWMLDEQAASLLEV